MGSTKLASTLVLLFLLQKCLIVNAQSSLPRLSLDEKNETLEKILKDIRKKTGYVYFVDVALLKQTKKVSFTIQDAGLTDVLDICFRDQPLSYQIVGNSITIKAKAQQLALITGKVVNDKLEPVAGATIMVKGEGRNISTATGDNGEFSLRLTDPNIKLVVSCISYETQVVTLGGLRAITVQLKAKVGELNDVVVSNGYQYIPKDRATGSFTQLDNEIINRRVSTNILDRMDGVTSGLIFNKNYSNNVNQSPITIRGRSTIFANPNPLIVIDNFPYSGDINNINPDDVESITVLKDAAAASIWGAFSGNGVIVITTKKGKYNQMPKLGFNTSVTIGAKQNPWYLPILPSGDVVDVEQFLFNQQFYASGAASSLHPALPPAVEIMLQQQNGLITSGQEKAMLDSLRGQDVRRDENKYFLRTGVNQQYSLNFSGGGPNNQYYLSGGYDKNLTNLTRNQYYRTTFNGTNTYKIIPNKLELMTEFAFTSSITTNNNSGYGQATYPYLKLADAQGNALAIPYILRQSYIDTAGGGKLLDWNYRPLDELRLADNVTKLTDYRINIGLRYTILKDLDARIYYQYGNGAADQKNYYSQQTFYTRNLINEFTQIDNQGNVTYNIPLGGILNETLNNYQANNARAQLNYDHSFTEDHHLTAIAGWELKDVEGQNKVTQQYGYDNNLQTSLPVNYITFFPQYPYPDNTAQIPYPDQSTGTSDRYLSYYINASYAYKKRYTLSASARRDESNLFGVSANQKGVPLWSVGGAWDISKEDFYKVDWLPMLKFRLTDGYNGNVDRSVSAYTTANINPGSNVYGALTSSIVNPPNPDLKWERINIVNAGLDFSTRNHFLEGSLEYYIKSGKDLIGQSPIDPTSGITTFTGNTANMVAHGVDLVLRTKATLGPFRWMTSFLFNYVRDEVTSYKVRLSTIQNYLNPDLINPLIGNPLYSVYILRWQGLDPLNGDPQGWLNGHVSKDYSGIANSADFSNLIYKGSVNPTVFGSLLNTFNWKQWGISFNIIYKLGYYFRRNSIDYYGLFTETSAGHPDYDRRWQKPGDEKNTYVPSMVYPANPDRDNFYTHSEVLIEKGDHIRFQDFQLTYDLVKKKLQKMPVQSMRFFVYVNNIGLLWTANRQHIDPDFISLTPNPRTMAIGLKMDL